MSTLAHDFNNFARHFPSMPIRWIALHYANRHLKSHQRIPPDMAFMLTYVMWADRKYSDSQPRVPAGSPDGGQWTSGDGGGGIVDTIGSFVDIPLQFVSMEWGTLIAELRPAFGTDTGRLCVYQFGDQSVIVPGPNNFSCLPNVTWASTWHGQILNDNVWRRF